MKEITQIMGLRHKLNEILNYKMEEFPITLFQALTIIGLGLDRSNPELRIGRERKDGKIEGSAHQNFQIIGRGGFKIQGIFVSQIRDIPMKIYS